jgi:hypothetical protein
LSVFPIKIRHDRRASAGGGRILTDRDARIDAASAAIAGRGRPD